nr:endothelial cell-specific chemotaxis regulator isoform X1 [Zootoca vivipara]
MYHCLIFLFGKTTTTWECNAVLSQEKKSVTKVAESYPNPLHLNPLYVPIVSIPSYFLVSTGIYNGTTSPTKGLLYVNTDFLTIPSPTEEKSAALTVAASGVISFIAILVVIVLILVCVVSLRFRCRHCKNVEDKQKHQHPMVSYSCSDAEAAVGKKNVMLVSMKDLNISNSQGAAKCITHEN